MKVFVFGGGEDVGEYILKRLKAEGHEAVTVSEEENRAEELRMMGASVRVVAENDDFTEALAGCEAIIFVANANPAAGESKNVLVDHKAVADSLEKASLQGIERLIYLSPVRVDESEESEKTGAKGRPEELIKQNGFIYTIVRTAKTVSKPGKGTIEAAESLGRSEGEIPYEDTAAVLVEALADKATFNKAFEIAEGETPIKEALHAL